MARKTAIEKAEIIALDGQPFVPEDNVPSINSKEWTDYVMSILDETEKVKLDGGEFPNIYGCRKIAERFIGPIIETSTIVNQAPSVANNYHSCITVNITLINNGVLIKSSGTADYYADMSMTENDYNFAKTYSSASCETKAESRALRRVTRMRKCAAEEFTVDIKPSGQTINNTQIGAMNNLCRQLDIDVVKFIMLSKEKPRHWREMPYANAIKAIGVLNEYLQKKQQVPETIVGYNPSWANS